MVYYMAYSAPESPLYLFKVGHNGVPPFLPSNCVNFEKQEAV